MALADANQGLGKGICLTIRRPGTTRVPQDCSDEAIVSMSFLLHESQRPQYLGIASSWENSTIVAKEVFQPPLRLPF